MDYEKAYKAVLKTATQWIKDGCTDKEKICLECVFPELRESERIRKWLVDYFGSIKETVWIHRDITCEQILEWLEKQKEQKPAWSEEDEFFRQQLIVYCEKGIQDPLAAKCVDWLKSFHPHSFWKPSEEQIYSLGTVIKGMGYVGVGSVGYNLKELYEQLKKL